jgi:hypothetical protein
MNFNPVPDRSAEEVQILVTAELGRIHDGSVTEGLRSFLITPRKEIGIWAFNSPTPDFPRWVVAESKLSGYCLLYSDYVYAPEAPWGLGSKNDKVFGADFYWFPTLEWAYMESLLRDEYNSRAK